MFRVDPGEIVLPFDALGGSFLPEIASGDSPEVVPRFLSSSFWAWTDNSRRRRRLCRLKKEEGERRTQTHRQGDGRKTNGESPRDKPVERQNEREIYVSPRQFVTASVLIFSA